MVFNCKLLPSSLILTNRVVRRDVALLHFPLVSQTITGDYSVIINSIDKVEVIVDLFNVKIW